MTHEEDLERQRHRLVERVITLGAQISRFREDERRALVELAAMLEEFHTVCGEQERESAAKALAG